MLSILSFIFGASIGSFVQVIASRFHVAPIVKGRSKCLSCGEALAVSDLIPVVSYFLLRGKCRYCKSKYGIEAVVVEVSFGLVFVLLYKLVLVGQPTMLLSTLWLVYYTALFGVLGVMAVYDRLHSYIPFSFLISYLGLTMIMFVLRISHEFSFVELFSPLLVALPFLVIWLVTKGKGLGFGDVVLFFGVGAFFGVLSGFAVFILSIWLGALVGLYIKYGKNKSSHRATAIPFVPFIVVAFLFVLFTGVDIFSIATIFS